MQKVDSWRYTANRGSPAPPELVERRLLAAQSLGQLPLAEGVTARESSMGGVPVTRFDVYGATSSNTLLYFHGGGYRLGSAEIFGSHTSHLCAVGGISVISVDYRLAPEEPFPAALLDAAAAYTRLIDCGVPGERIFVGGDSAGGGLAAALLLEIPRLGLPRPAGAVLLSPWLDLRNIAASFYSRADTDSLFSKAAADEAAAMYLAGASADDCRASPLLGDWDGQPKLLIQASGSEVLHDDAVALAKRAGEAGVSVTLQISPDLPHVWQLAYPVLPAAVRAIHEIAKFVSDPS